MRLIFGPSALNGGHVGDGDGNGLAFGQRPWAFRLEWDCRDGGEVDHDSSAAARQMIENISLGESFTESI